MKEEQRCGGLLDRIFITFVTRLAGDGVFYELQKDGAFVIVPNSGKC